MPRPSKLTDAQCAQIRALKNHEDSPIRVPVLAKQFGVSESSIYKVLDGTYVARKYFQKTRNIVHTDAHTIPSVPYKDIPQGPMPSIFRDKHGVGDMVNQAAKQDFDVPLDEATIAAAELVLARARLIKALGH